jgi:hypothetical protein
MPQNRLATCIGNKPSVCFDDAVANDAVHEALLAADACAMLLKRGRPDDEQRPDVHHEVICSITLKASSTPTDAIRTAHSSDQCIFKRHAAATRTRCEHATSTWNS